MRSAFILLIVSVFFISGCYDSPLTKEHSIPIDTRILGLWGKGDSKAFIVLKYSNTEYLFHIFAGNDDVYFRGYPIKIGNILCIQIQAIGSDDGPAHQEEKPFYVVTYQLINDEIEYKIINTDLVNKKLQGSETLKKAFLKHKNNKDLFVEPKTYRRFKD